MYKGISNQWVVSRVLSGYIVTKRLRCTAVVLFDWAKEPNGTLSCEHLNLSDLPFPMAEEEPTNGADAAPAEDAAALALAAMPGIPGMDPAAYAQWLQAVQAQQVAAQQLYLQQIAAASGGVFALPQVAGAIPGLAGAAALPGLGAAAAIPGLARLPGLAPKAEGPVYTGQVVDYNEDRGFGFIECKETQELYGGKDIFLLRSGLNGLIVSTGDRVNFRVERGIKGPKAVEVEVVERIQDMAERLPRYWGIVKNFDNTRGLGFIECEETKEVYDKDILALRTQLGDAEEGAVCSFNIVQDARGVKAANVKVHPEGFPPGMEPQPRPKGKGKGKFGKDDGKGFSKFGKGFNKGKFEEFYSMAQNMLQDWGWYSGGGDGWWGEGGWDDGSWWEGDATGKGKGEGARFTPY